MPGSILASILQGKDVAGYKQGLARSTSCRENFLTAVEKFYTHNASVEKLLTLDISEFVIFSDLLKVYVTESAFEKEYLSLRRIFQLATAIVGGNHHGTSVGNGGNQVAMITVSSRSCLTDLKCWRSISFWVHVAKEAVKQDMSYWAKLCMLRNNIQSRTKKNKTPPEIEHSRAVSVFGSTISDSQVRAILVVVRVQAIFAHMQSELDLPGGTNGNGRQSFMDKCMDQIAEIGLKVAGLSWMLPLLPERRFIYHLLRLAVLILGPAAISNYMTNTTTTNATTTTTTTAAATTNSNIYTMISLRNNRIEFVPKSAEAACSGTNEHQGDKSANTNNTNNTKTPTSARSPAPLPVPALAPLNVPVAYGLVFSPVIELIFAITTHQLRSLMLNEAPAPAQQPRLIKKGSAEEWKSLNTGSSSNSSSSSTTGSSNINAGNDNDKDGNDDAVTNIPPPLVSAEEEALLQAARDYDTHVSTGTSTGTSSRIHMGTSNRNSSSSSSCSGSSNDDSNCVQDCSLSVVCMCGRQCRSVISRSSSSGNNSSSGKNNRNNGSWSFLDTRCSSGHFKQQQSSSPRLQAILEQLQQQRQHQQQQQLGTATGTGTGTGTSKRQQDVANVCREWLPAMMCEDCVRRMLRHSSLYSSAMPGMQSTNSTSYNTSTAAAAVGNYTHTGGGGGGMTIPRPASRSSTVVWSESIQSTGLIPLDTQSAFAASSCFPAAGTRMSANMCFESIYPLAAASGASGATLPSGHDHDQRISALGDFALFDQLLSATLKSSTDTGSTAMDPAGSSPLHPTAVLSNNIVSPPPKATIPVVTPPPQPVAAVQTPTQKRQERLVLFVMHLVKGIPVNVIYATKPSRIEKARFLYLKASVERSNKTLLDCIASIVTYAENIQLHNTPPQHRQQQQQQRVAVDAKAEEAALLEAVRLRGDALMDVLAAVSLQLCWGKPLSNTTTNSGGGGGGGGTGGGLLARYYNPSSAVSGGSSNSNSNTNSLYTYASDKALDVDALKHIKVGGSTKSGTPEWVSQCIHFACTTGKSLIVRLEDPERYRYVLDGITSLVASRQS
eukprot:CAMPEP_0175006324 /NCGR_PEP_ID=MMETSP0005-20121125/5796_1 /TAXON_ID=420556 /ORGANISM="Ochromonas sp., Strain CCMP1393" /LENGTH=1061 /DNA_ID=CAMNT_0016261649 /DNA_START=1239 /DNA_END=4424 /DNA_ORIENTATION=-